MINGGVFMRKTMSKKSLIASFVAIMASVVFLFGATRISSAKAQEAVTPVASWTLKAEGTDYTVTQHTMTEVCGISGSALQQDAMLWRQDTSASSDTSTNLIYSPSIALTAAGAYYAVHFAQNADKKIGTDINTVVVKLYAHLTADGSAYSTDNGGIRLYAPDDTGANNSGYMIPGDIAQNQWVDLVISGEDLVKLSDSNGYFSGFTAGNSAVSNLRFNNGWQYTDDFSWIAFDSFTGYSEYYVTFDDGVNKTSQFIAADTPITAPAAEKEGYTLLGWYDENGVKVDLTAGVKKSCTLTAKWQPADGTLKAADGSGYNDGGQTNRKVKDVYGAALNVPDMMFWDSATHPYVNRADAPAGYPIYSVSTNHAGASPTITFGGPALSLKNADGSWKSIVVRVYAHLTTDKSAYYTENGGIRLYGADDDGTNNSGYMIPANIPQDQWVYLEIPGEYLSDKNGDFSGFAVGSNVAGGAAIEEGNKMYAGGSWSAEGSYVLFDTFTVGSNLVEFHDGDTVTQQLIAENGKAIAPEAKGKAFDETYHYTFDGWYNGEQKWNFEDAVTASMTLECRYVGEAHVYGEGVITPPTQTEKGYTTYTCTCGHSYRGDETETLPADETLVNIYGTSLSVEDRIGLNIYVDKLTEKKVFMLVTTSNGEERVACRDIKSGYYRYTIYLPAQDYAKEVAFRFVDEDGSQSKTYRYSIKAYAEQAKNNPSVDENTKAVIDAMEDYATLAKAYFNDEQATVPETVANVQNAVFDTYTVATEGSLPAGVSVKGITLIFNSEITLRLYCVFDESVPASDIAITVNGTVAEWQEKTIDGVKYRYVDCSGIAAADLGSVIDFKVGDCTVSCSALSYANVILKNGTQNEMLINTLKALYLYHNACKTCFAK